MIKRGVVLGVVGIFLAVPPAIAESSSNVKKVTATAPTAGVPSSGHDGQCPLKAQSADL